MLHGRFGETRPHDSTQGSVAATMSTCLNDAYALATGCRTYAAGPTSAGAATTAAGPRSRPRRGPPLAGRRAVSRRGRRRISSVRRHEMWTMEHSRTPWRTSVCTNTVKATTRVRALCTVSRYLLRVVQLLARTWTRATRRWAPSCRVLYSLQWWQFPSCGSSHIEMLRHQGSCLGYLRPHQL